MKICNDIDNDNDINDIIIINENNVYYYVCMCNEMCNINV